MHEFEELYGFPRRYTNGLVGKQDRGIPSWIYTHIHYMNNMLKKNGSIAYVFNLRFVLFNEIEDAEKMNLIQENLNLKKEIQSFREKQSI